MTLIDDDNDEIEQEHRMLETDRPVSRYLNVKIIALNLCYEYRLLSEEVSVPILPPLDIPHPPPLPGNK